MILLEIQDNQLELQLICIQKYPSVPWYGARHTQIREEDDKKRI
jgi:hypothetical protein